MSTSRAELHRSGTDPSYALLRERDERLESLKFLMGKLVHDFNNFLVPLLGYVGLLKDDLPQGSNGVTYADAMDNAFRKTETYLDVMLLAVRPYRNFQPKPLDFQNLVKNAVAEWKAALPGNAAIEVEQDISACHLTVDEAQWVKVLGQLLANARFALAMGGKVEIRLEPQTLSSEQMLDLNIADSSVFLLTVRDNGFGMAPNVLRRACEPFFTTRSGSTAMGLGLTLVHSVSHLHGGQMIIESAEDKGTTVTVWIPVSPVRTAASGVQRKAALLKPAQNSSRSKILLIEADPIVREVLKPCLQQTNHDVFLASDGEEALRIFRRFARDWALVVSSADLSKINGWDVCNAIGAEDSDVPVILIASVGVNADSSTPQSAQANFQVLTRPLNLKRFKEAVQKYLSVKT
jgi:nitrogen-specific signal transduction histidine kinase